MKRSWGVRREGGVLASLERSVNPTEEIIAQEIRELKEREEELVRRREEQGDQEEQEEPRVIVMEEPEVEEVETVETVEAVETVETVEVPPARFITTTSFKLNEPKPINNNR